MKTQLTLLATAVMLAGCGGSGGGSDESLPTYTVSGTVNAHAAQGNEKVCIDLSQDFVCDSGEPSTTANNGSYSITTTNRAILNAPIVVELETGVTSLSSRAAASNDTAVLIAPAQGNSSGNDVNVVSTLIAGYIASGETLETATGYVETQLQALGLPSDDLLNQGDRSEYQVLEQNVLTLTSAMEASKRNEQIFALAFQLDEYRDFVLKSAPTDQEATDALTKIEQNLTLSQVAYREQNDTGLTKYIGDGAIVDSSPADFPGQDADYGSDKNDGGFKFVKLDVNGQPLAADATEWSCVQDERSGLIWETKLDDAASPRHFERLFAYQESGVIEPFIEDINYLGCRDGDNICTTEEYVEYLNKQNVCGINNWRLPTSGEVYNLIDFAETQLDGDEEAYGFTYAYFPLQGNSSYLEEGVIWTKLNMFTEYSINAEKYFAGYSFAALQTRGPQRGETSFVDIYTDKTAADNSDSYQFAIRLVAQVEAK
ncbi:Lcl domain-containing protein [Vibrio sinaloensis]|uniref:Lcl domain-containing protein n=1 Tax=Photobacterium sp. (strain ATCC 43367) TaxID=379097 RepID=UPI0035E918AE